MFRAFGRKTQIVGKIWDNFENFWWKFNRKIEFLINFGKFVTLNRGFGNNTIFLQQFFRFRGEGNFPPSPPPLPTPLVGRDKKQEKRPTYDPIQMELYHVLSTRRIDRFTGTVLRVDDVVQNRSIEALLIKGTDSQWCDKRTIGY